MRLKKTFGVEAELCASPVNCRFRNFGSAFLDVDRHFGSFGSVFAFKPVTGSFQANPPFDSAFIGRLVKRLETLLRDTNEPLSFVLIVPYWPEEACWKNLTSSPFKRTPLLRLKKNKHGYVAGSSATRVKRTTPASFTTDVVFLQNEAGAFKWPVTDTTLRAIKIGFKEGLPNSSRKREDDDDDDADASMSSSDGGGGSSETGYDSSGDDLTKPSRSFGNEGDEVKAALRLSKGKVWDPDEFLFWGVGSARRWGERPAEWMLDAAGDVLEAHWVGEDPDSEEEDEEEEGEEAEEGDSEEEPARTKRRRATSSSRARALRRERATRNRRRRRGVPRRTKRRRRRTKTAKNRLVPQRTKRRRRTTTTRLSARGNDGDDSNV
jgi:phosphorylated CTD-interacting factor 1